MFSVCLFTAGGTSGVTPYQLGGTPQPGGGVPQGFPPTGGGGGTPINLDKNVGQKMDKHFGNFWRWGRGRYASCGHAGGLSFFHMNE